MGFFRVKQPFVPPVMSLETEHNIVLNAAGTEMLRVATDGFYVRGIKLKQDDKEAEQVYNAFKAWLAWANLTQT